MVHPPRAGAADHRRLPGPGFRGLQKGPRAQGAIRRPVELRRVVRALPVEQALHRHVQRDAEIEAQVGAQREAIEVADPAAADPAGHVARVRSKDVPVGKHDRAGLAEAPRVLDEVRLAEPPAAKPGDVVTLGIEGLGEQRQKVVAAK